MGTWVAAFKGSAESTGYLVMKGSNLAPAIWTVKPRVANMQQRPCASSASRYHGNKRLFLAKPSGSKPTSPAYFASAGLLDKPWGTGAQGNASDKPEGADAARNCVLPKRSTPA